MSLNLASFEMAQSRKRNFGDLRGPSACSNEIDNAVFLATEATSEQVGKSPSHSTSQLISSSSSCEESCSLSSNDSTKTYSDVASESHTVSSFGSNFRRVTRTADPSCSLRHLRRRNTRVKGQVIAAQEPPQSNDWDHSSWFLPSSAFMSVDKEEGNDTVDTSLAATNTLTTNCCFKQGKAQGVVFATAESLDSKIIVWEDTHWQLPDLSSTLKKRKTTPFTRISTEKNHNVIHLESPYSIDTITSNNYGDVKSDQRGESLTSCRGSVKRRLCKRFNEAHCTDQQDDFSRMPFIPDVATEITTITNNQHLSDHRTSSIDSPCILFRWLRARLEAGLVRSSFDFLHRTLKKYYDEVNHVVTNLGNDETPQNVLGSLASLRDRLAGIWCVYAHFTLEVGCLVYSRTRNRESSSFGETPSQKLFKNSSGNRVEKCSSPTQTAPRVAMEHTHGGERSRNTAQERNNLTFDCLSNHAISILLTARDCPFVGNHTAIGVSLGRLIVSSTVLKESKFDCVQVQLSREALKKNIQSAIDVCWDSIDMCRFNRCENRRYAIEPMATSAIKSLSNFELKCDKSIWEKEVRTEVGEGINSTLLLPMTLRNSWPSTFPPSNENVVGDKETIRCLCKELNRWSRLKEKLEVDSQDTIRIRPSYDSKMSFATERLPLFASLESLSDPLNRYKDVDDPGKGIIWQW